MNIDKTNRELYWTAIDIANNAGKDKLSFDDRIKWVEENIEHINDIGLKADSPWELRNAVSAFYKILDGEEVAHRVYLDASNQALQLYAILTADKQTASTCNLASGNIMADAYQMLADAMNIQLKDQGYDLIFTRSDCKKALMTTMYGKADGSAEIVNHMVQHISNQYDRFQYFADKFRMTMDVNKLSQPFIPKLQEIFKDAIVDIAPTAVTTMDALTEMNKEYHLEEYRWTLPDGFKVSYRVYEEITIPPKRYTTRAGYKVTTPSITKRVYKENVNSRAISPNIIHSVDGYVAREMIRRMDGRFITTIHDAFACHPRDCDLMRSNYQDIMVELLNSTLLYDIVEEILGGNTSVVKRNTLTEEDIRNSVYFLS